MQAFLPLFLKVLSFTSCIFSGRAPQAAHGLCLPSHDGLLTGVPGFPTLTPVETPGPEDNCDCCPLPFEPGSRPLHHLPSTPLPKPSDSSTHTRPTLPHIVTSHEEKSGPFSLLRTLPGLPHSIWSPHGPLTFLTSAVATSWLPSVPLSRDIRLPLLP